MDLPARPGIFSVDKARPWIDRVVKNHENPRLIFAPVAQLDRVLGYEPSGREFESLQARHSPTKLGT